MNPNAKLIAAALASLGVTAFGVSVIKYIKTQRKLRAKDDEITRNLHLDLDALRRTSEVIRMKGMLGEFRECASYEIEKAFLAEYEFQKIAVRES